MVETINQLSLPRYGLGNYGSAQRKALTEAEERQIKGLSRAEKRLMGFSRTNLFKRLESGGPAFIQSIDRHIGEKQGRAVRTAFGSQVQNLRAAEALCSGGEGQFVRLAGFNCGH